MKIDQRECFVSEGDYGPDLPNLVSSEPRPVLVRAHFITTLIGFAQRTVPEGDREKVVSALQLLLEEPVGRVELGGDGTVNRESAAGKAYYAEVVKPLRSQAGRRGCPCEKPEWADPVPTDVSDYNPDGRCSTTCAMALTFPPDGCVGRTNLPPDCHTTQCSQMLAGGVQRCWKFMRGFDRCMSASRFFWDTWEFLNPQQRAACSNLLVYRLMEALFGKPASRVRPLGGLPAALLLTASGMAGRKVAEWMCPRRQWEVDADTMAALYPGWRHDAGDSGSLTLRLGITCKEDVLIMPGCPHTCNITRICMPLRAVHASVLAFQTTILLAGKDERLEVPRKLLAVLCERRADFARGLIGEGQRSFKDLLVVVCIMSELCTSTTTHGDCEPPCDEYTQEGLELQLDEASKRAITLSPASLFRSAFGGAAPGSSPVLVSLLKWLGDAALGADFPTRWQGESDRGFYYRFCEWFLRHYDTLTSFGKVKAAEGGWAGLLARESGLAGWVLEQHEKRVGGFSYRDALQSKLKEGGEDHAQREGLAFGRVPPETVHSSAME